MEGRHVGLDFYDLLIEAKRLISSVVLIQVRLASKNPATSDSSVFQLPKFVANGSGSS
jgi:hypothetical protein